MREIFLVKVLSRFVLRRAGLIAIIGTVAALVGGYYSVLLYMNLRPDIEELLPTTARSVVDLNEVTHRLESIDNLAIVIFSKNGKASRRFVDDLARELNKGPKNVVSSVEYRIDKELKFFKDRRALYLDLEDLLKVRNYIRDKISYEKQIRNPLNIFSNSYIPEPQLDFKAMQRKYEGKVSAYSRFPDGYYATPDESMRAVLVYLAGKSSGIEQVHKLKDFVTATIAKINPKSYAPDIEIKFTGGVENVIEEQQALIADLELSTVIVVVLVTLAMFIFFRSVSSSLILVLSLFTGTIWTFGIAYFAVGYLNANSAFLGSIVIGNGINYGIIYLARYIEERRRGRNHVRGIYLATTHTATATWTAALAAALSYGSLVLTGFRGFRQFGIIGLIGMVLCWVSAFTILPAILTLYHRKRVFKRPPQGQEQKAYVAGTIATLVSRHPAIVWGASFALTAVALTMFTKYSPNILESNLARLRSKTSSEHGSAYNSKYIDEIFQRYLSPMAVLPRSKDDAYKIAANLKEMKKREGDKSLIVSVQMLDDFLPNKQREKFAVMQEIRDLLPPRIMRRISRDERNTINEFLTREAMMPITTNDLPPLILGKFTEKDKSIGKLVLVEPPLTDATWEGSQLISFVHGLRQAADSVAPGTPVAGHLPISADMIESIMTDGPKATLFAFLAVVTLVIIFFRSVKTVTLTLFALIIGIIWLFGAILAFDLKINFLNFIALPITFGIGVDYGVNIFQRYREEGSGSIIRVIRDTGGAVAFSSFTTIVGYGSLLIAENQAFVSFGRLAVLGELTCVSAAIISLPAFLMLRDRRRQRARAANQVAPKPNPA